MKKANLPEPHNIPVYVISYNRLSYLKQTITWLESMGHNQIIIIDNHSTYEPLLQYYATIKHKVYRLRRNWGHNVFFKNPRFYFKRNFNYFVLTDPDLYPIQNCPNDYMKHFLEVLSTHPAITKVGFSLKINDLPNEYNLKQTVIEWENQFYQNPISWNDLTLYHADIDTTFALYRPKRYWRFKKRYSAIRIGAPYQLHHLPWYIIEDNEENSNYCKTLNKKITTWNGNLTPEEISKRQ